MRVLEQIDQLTIRNMELSGMRNLEMLIAHGWCYEVFG
ncbi:MAG: hypothetical protein ACJAWN_001961 [Neolewinella sp.]|jgi:hypothetical protein